MKKRTTTKKKIVTCNEQIVLVEDFQAYIIVKL